MFQTTNQIALTENAGYPQIASEQWDNYTFQWFFFPGDPLDSRTIYVYIYNIVFGYNIANNRKRYYKIMICN